MSRYLIGVDVLGALPSSVASKVVARPAPSRVVQPSAPPRSTSVVQPSGAGARYGATVPPSSAPPRSTVVPPSRVPLSTVSKVEQDGLAKAGADAANAAAGALERASARAASVAQRIARRHPRAAAKLQTVAARGRSKASQARSMAASRAAAIRTAVRGVDELLGFNDSILERVTQFDPSSIAQYTAYTNAMNAVAQAGEIIAQLQDPVATATGTRAQQGQRIIDGAQAVIDQTDLSDYGNVQDPSGTVGQLQSQANAWLSGSSTTTDSGGGGGAGGGGDAGGDVEGGGDAGGGAGGGGEAGAAEGGAAEEGEPSNASEQQRGESEGLRPELRAHLGPNLRLDAAPLSPEKRKLLWKGFAAFAVAGGLLYYLVRHR